MKKKVRINRQIVGNRDRPTTALEQKQEQLVTENTRMNEPIQKQKNNYRNQDIEFRKDLYQRFQNFNIEQSFQKIIKQFKNLLGRHKAMNYQQKFNFQQRWQQQSRVTSNKNQQGTILSLLQGIIQLFIINLYFWAISMKVTFQIKNIFWLTTLAIIVSLKSIGKTIYFYRKYKGKKKTKLILKESLFIILSLILIPQLDIKIPQFLSIAMSVYILWILYENSTKIYQRLKIYHLPQKYRDLMKIFDLFFLLASVTHFFALILYYVTKLNPQRNWILSIDMQDHQWDTKYIYSIYFSCTTLLTVGYGDISPTNKVQIFAVLLTQIIGIATFAYTVNQIGTALSKIQSKRQKLNRDLANVQRIGNQYRLQPDDLCRMRNQLIRNAALIQQLRVEQQTELLNRFSDDLRTSIQVESSLKVIKKSLFMICNWTGKFQSKIASKLIKQIYTAEQFLPQIPGKQKIYILQRGRLDIMNSTKKSQRIAFRKILKTIKVQKQVQIAVQNVYGYSAVISNHVINLRAVSKENSIVYSINKNDFLQILNESEQDFQHLHQIKSKIDLCRMPQELQAPAIASLRQHYKPSAYYLILQNRKKNKRKNHRSSYIRKPSRQSIILKQGQQCNLISQRNLKSNKHIWEMMNSAKNSKTIDQINEYCSNKQIEQSNDFQCCKQFQRYFKKSNYDQIIKKLNYTNYIKKPSNIFSKSGHQTNYPSKKVKNIEK